MPSAQYRMDHLTIITAGNRTSKAAIMIVIRLVRLTDLDALERLAKRAEAGLMTLLADRNLPEKKIAASREAFGPNGNVYILATKGGGARLPTETREVLGCSQDAIESTVSSISSVIWTIVL